MDQSRKDETLTATAECTAKPSAPASVSTKQNVSLTGAHSFKISNPGASAISVKIEVVIEDSEGHKRSDSESVSIPAKGTETGTMNTLLVAAYDKPGNVTVTARTIISGDAFCSTASGQNMHVV